MQTEKSKTFINPAAEMLARDPDQSARYGDLHLALAEEMAADDDQRDISAENNARRRCSFLKVSSVDTSQSATRTL